MVIKVEILATCKTIKEIQIVIVKENQVAYTMANILIIIIKEILVVKMIMAIKSCWILAIKRLSYCRLPYSLLLTFVMVKGSLVMRMLGFKHFNIFMGCIQMFLYWTFRLIFTIQPRKESFLCFQIMGDLIILKQLFVFPHFSLTFVLKYPLFL